MKHLAFLAVVLLTLTSYAGSLKNASVPNITRNAGQTIPVTFTGSGWPAGQTAQVWLLNARTWELDLVWIDQPVVNGANALNLEIPWSWWGPGRYLVKVVAGNTQATTTSAVTIRTAIKWPYGGTVWHPGQAVKVTWETRGSWSEYTDIYLRSEDGSSGCAAVPAGTVDIDAGRLDFVIPSWLTPGVYRIHIDCYIWMVEEDWEFLDLFAFTQSERIVIQ